MILSKLTVARLRVSRDIALVVLFSIISFFYGAAVTPLSMLLMVIPGALHLFGLGHSIIVSLALLTYEGRRWRFLLQGLLVTLLFLPTTAGGIPFDILSRLPIVFGSFLGDLIFSSTYGRFKNLEKLRLWVVLASVTFFFMDLKDAEKIEFEAMRRRHNRLLIYAAEKDCDMGEVRAEKIPSLKEQKKEAEKILKEAKERGEEGVEDNQKDSTP